MGSDVIFAALGPHIFAPLRVLVYDCITVKYVFGWHASQYNNVFVVARYVYGCQVIDGKDNAGGCEILCATHGDGLVSPEQQAQANAQSELGGLHGFVGGGHESSRAVVVQIFYFLT